MDVQQHYHLSAACAQHQGRVLFQVDLSKWESALGPEQVGAGPSLHATPSAPLPCHRPGPAGESIIPAGFPYTPDEWSSASATGLACVDGCGASMARCHQAHQPATNLTGLACGSVNRQEEIALCSDHDGSLLRQQPRVVALCACWLHHMLKAQTMIIPMHIHSKHG